MSTLHINATERTPEVQFDFAGNVFLLKGEKKEGFRENVV